MSEENKNTEIELNDNSLNDFSGGMKIVTDGNGKPVISLEPGDIPLILGSKNPIDKPKPGK